MKATKLRNGVEGIVEELETSFIEGDDTLTVTKIHKKLCVLLNKYDGKIM